MKGHVKYPKIPRLGTAEAEGILQGEIEIYPKMDGTNASIWWDDGVACGSRNKELALGDDNAGFCAYVQSQAWIKGFIETHKNLRIFGEWLVPHTIKDYRKDAWRKLYVYDVFDEDESQFLQFGEYKELLQSAGFLVLKPVYMLEPTSERIELVAPDIARYAMEAGAIGEGIVIKNYSFTNRFGMKTHAKYVLEHFKEVKQDISGYDVESTLAAAIVSSTLVHQCASKIMNSHASKHWNRPLMIPELMRMVQHDVYQEELYTAIVDMKYPIVNHKKLQGCICYRIKQCGPEYF